MILLELVPAATAGLPGPLRGRTGRWGPRRRCPIPEVPARWCHPAVAAVWSCAVASVVVGAFPPWWLPTQLITGLLLVLLTACDLRHRRLPDVLTLGGCPLVLGALLLAAVLGAPTRLPLWGLVGAVVFGGSYAVVRLIAPCSLGAGDVKFAVLLGLAIGGVTPLLVPVVMLGAAVGTLVTAGFLRRRAVPHGPAMALSAWLVIGAPVF
ncbi:prepilin peptidase [Actinopolyspora saharensis]|uniref:prepilin peptidase n=1 Tax=Actinopolyspora saharensis TaxID=995062 RepID=UPI000B833063|nr:A24 family peptidase [Actinopolyspora saharensis]